MGRKLKHHEQKLLRKVDFNTYKSDNDHREHAIMRRYGVQKRDDYAKYNRLAGSLRQLAHKIAALEPTDDFRRKHEDLMLEKLFTMGILGTGGSGRGKLSDVEHKVTVSAFCRRRLPVVMTKLRMADNVTAAIKFIEQGHVRVGTDVMTDPAYLVTRNMEDFVTWVDSSKIKRNIMKYRDQLDDFELEAL
ncbi:Small subunit (SSU) processome component [Paraphaeosphaeria sporulosa]|uniref:U3 small nucleolar ribonucleoprotein protein IMP3 n=1 Tax=Paraphaeosphaeria sporulosa TaxID=1460663 RepID=A0A177CXG3_9PLEO|nr:u3 small nucleolar ribonucleoprotein-like protein imp3 [Paraphaeosphaeria sporulosa]OAG11409.1 u3 small nucleolar ribonucleoprotein-like protein imp3 [Paraphaeosphaeria sporulosa]